MSSYNELGEALQFFRSHRSPDYSTVSQALPLVLEVEAFSQSDFMTLSQVFLETRPGFTFHILRKRLLAVQFALLRFLDVDVWA